jgi:hypothetical protein
VLEWMVWNLDEFLLRVRKVKSFHDNVMEILRKDSLIGEGSNPQRSGMSLSKLLTFFCIIHQSTFHPNLLPLQSSLSANLMALNSLSLFGYFLGGVTMCLGE